MLRGEIKPSPELKNKWIVDSGCTSHMCNDASMFESLEEKTCQPVEVGEGHHVEVAGVGNVTGTAVVDGKKETVMFKSVLFVPTMMCNLLSVSKARRAGCRVTFDGNDKGSGYCEIIQKTSQKVCLKGIERPRDCMRRYSLRVERSVHSRQ